VTLLVTIAQFAKRRSAFTKWLIERGSAIEKITNPYEVLRFTTPEGVGIIYKNGNGQITSWQGGAAEAGEAPATAEERLETLIEAAENLLLGGVAETGQPRVGVANGTNLVGLIDEAEALALPVVCLDALLQRRVVQVAEGAEHDGEAVALGAIGVEPKLVADYHAAGFRSGSSGSLVKNPPSVNARGGFALRTTTRRAPQPKRRRRIPLSPQGGSPLRR
jgi:hypothetical protein